MTLYAFTICVNNDAESVFKWKNGITVLNTDISNNKKHIL